MKLMIKKIATTGIKWYTFESVLIIIRNNTKKK